MPTHLWRSMLRVCGTLMILALQQVAAADDAGTARRNVVLIVTDDQRPDSIGALGNPYIRTPHLDRLVATGTTFTRAITAVPICVASRAELLTGRDERLNGRGDFGFSPTRGVDSFATTLADAGYETCYVGKWHTRGRPSMYGYSTTEGLFGSGGGRFPLTHPVDWKGMAVTGYRGWVFQDDAGNIDPAQGVGLTPNISERFADAAIRFLRRRGTEPFLLHVNFTAPHDPLFVPEGYSGRYRAEAMPLPPNFRSEHPFDHGNRSGRDEVLFGFPRTIAETRAGLAVYYSVIEHLDQQFGRILEEIKTQGLADETLVIFTSDHGLAMGSHGLRGKQNMYDHSIGVPLIVRGPGIESGERTDAQCYLRDLYPTICEFCGVDVPESVHGASLWPVLRGERDELHPAVYAHFRGVQRAIRTNEWKLIEYPEANRRQLFHLASDPHELRDRSENVADQRILEQLAIRLSAWVQDAASASPEAEKP